MKVAIIRNRDMDGIVSRFGQPCPETYGKRSVQMVIDSLRADGHTVGFFEGDKRLIDNLEQFMPPDPHTGRPGGMVLNLSYGIQGDCRYAHVPGMLEMAGIPYTGSSPLGHALALDKVVTKVLMMGAGVPTPNYRVLSRPSKRVDDGLRFPLIVKPRHESTSYGLHFVRDGDELEKAVLEVVTQYQQDALVEEYIEGREVCVGLLGNDPVEFLPPVELDFHGRDLHALTWADKYHKSPDEPEKICPAPVCKELADRLYQMSLATFRACRCKDYSRIDIRIDPSGNPFVLEINSMASLGPGGAFVLAAEKAGYNFQALICRILDIAHLRYFGTLKPTNAPTILAEAERPKLITCPSELTGRELQQSDLVTGSEQGEAGTTDSRYVSSRQELIDHLHPCKVTKFYEEQIRRSGWYEQLKHIVEPSEAELEISGALDTSGEHDNTKMKGLQHKYPQTALMLVTDQCFSHCRFCFRKRLVGRPSQEVAQDYADISEYIKGHPEITDVLLTGGDPFVLDTEQLQTVIDHLLPIPHLTSIRFGTRALVYCPLRFRDKTLADLFRRIRMAKKAPVIVTHIDHVGEVSEETELAVRKLRRLGVQFFNQTVLLKNVNDDPAVLAATFRRLHALGIRPYYLFQARPVKGALHFQVPLHRGVEIVHDVNRCLSGIQKTYRYIMAHYTGKIEILDIGEDNCLYMRYHQSTDPLKIGMVFSRPYREDAYWLDDLPCLSEVPETI
jgi:lysine 2,3-aminomutase